MQLQEGLRDDDVPQLRGQVLHELRGTEAQGAGDVLGGVAHLHGNGAWMVVAVVVHQGARDPCTKCVGLPDS